MRKDKISNAVIRRLPRYCRNLAALRREGVERISSSALGKNMGLTASQIRQDLSCFGEFGQQGYGYNVDTLYQEIREILGLHRQRSAILVGAGNLGRALIRNFDFVDSGFRLEAAFDVRPELIGTEMHGVPVHDAAELGPYLETHAVAVAVLTLPPQSAQKTADLLMDKGIRGIWNFTNFDFEVGEEHAEVVVESMHFSDSLQVLSYLIRD
ncbi:MAG TPA: redox-sensing transcriptional repressor Rex [Candidatus Onthomonas avicola]|nr:redox-sensing transcriptional repressor Rex [Candidatus Onthomonas avicola]